MGDTRSAVRACIQHISLDATKYWEPVHRIAPDAAQGRSERSVERRRTKPAHFSTIAELFAERGFRTGAVVNNPFLLPSFGMDRGFAEYDDGGGRSLESRGADVIVDRSLRMIDEWSGDPFFLVIHMFDPHLNYDAPPGFRGTFTGGLTSTLTLPISERRYGDGLTEDDKNFIRVAYDEEIAFVDQQLARLQNALGDRGLLESSLVVLTSDHGEELFDHGGFEHGHAMWQELLHVPLIIWGGGVVPGRESSPVSIVDIPPTLLEWAGYSVPSGLDGRSLWPTLSGRGSLRDRPLIAEGMLYGGQQSAIIQWPVKVVLDAAGTPNRVFDLDIDPGERESLLGASGTDEVAQVVRELGRTNRVHSLNDGEYQDEAAEPTQETLDRLRSLGYVR